MSAANVVRCFGLREWKAAMRAAMCGWDESWEDMLVGNSAELDGG